MLLKVGGADLKVLSLPTAAFFVPSTHLTDGKISQFASII